MKKIGIVSYFPGIAATLVGGGIVLSVLSPDLKAVIKENIPEGDLCQTTAEEMAEQGCNIIIADSFGHEDYMIAAANKCNRI